MPVLMPWSRASRDEETIVAALGAEAAIASGFPRRLASCCCSIDAKAQFRSTTRVVGEAVFRPSSLGAIKQMFAQNCQVRAIQLDARFELFLHARDGFVQDRHDPVDLLPADHKRR